MKIMKTFAIVITMMLMVQAYAQTNALELSSNRNDDRSVTISYQKNLPGTYSLALKFSRIDNAFHPDRIYTVNGYSGKVTTLKPINEDKSINYQYKYQYILGEINPKKIDPSFTYMLPFRAGLKRKVEDLGFMGSMYFNEKRPDSWRALMFRSEQADSIFVMRKGIVVDVKDEHEIDTTSAFSYSSDRNQITIQHKDGTMAVYKGFERKSIDVELGETVYPGSFLGVLAPYNRDSYQLRVSIYYRTGDYDDLFFSDAKIGERPPTHGYIDPYFLTEKGRQKLASNTTYTAAYSEELFLEELSRRELKKWKKGEW